MEKRTNGKNRISSVSIFSSRLKCGCCDGYYGSIVWHSNSKYKRKIWQCNNKFKESCTTPHFSEDEIKAIFVQATNNIINRRKKLIKEHELLVERVLDVSELEIRKYELEAELKVTVDLVNECINENTKVIQNQEEYQVRYNSLVTKYENIKEELDKINSEILDKQTRKDQIQTFIKTLKCSKIIIEFNDELWCSLIEEIEIKMIVQR
ncbi:MULTISPECIES: zinc ribbon domain-containing protein [unclassified Gemella]|uniref:zinc ribbon domain-containing protein n=1 Tax=unclassified Gemella TaxID=2624949 RepID=UPI001D1683E1|nr:MULTISPECIES: zinc ribbon domain-containing protein [unclassified Gemella]